MNHKQKEGKKNMEQEKFYKLRSYDSDVKDPEYLYKFKYLGYFSINPELLGTVNINKEISMLEKYYLVVIEKGAFIIRVYKVEEVFEFLYEKEWYSNEDKQLLILQTYSTYILRDSKGYEEWEDCGISPLIQEEKAEEILKGLFSFHN